MKKWMILLLSVMLVIMMCACDGMSSANSQPAGEMTTRQQTETEIQSSEKDSDQDIQSGETTEQGKTLVAYFSATGTTRPVAEKMAEILGADLYEIVPAQSYSEGDLNYKDDSCRANREQNDSAARPEISEAVENMEQYDTVLIGHPIWWGEEPRILDTFMESYDWSGKTLANFCTSGGSGISTAASHLKELAPDAVWLDGNRFESGASETDITKWMEGIGILGSMAEKSRIYIKIGEYTLTVAMADNSSAAALIELLKDGDITVSASDYGNFEKVGSLGTSLPTNDEQITTVPGDVILYQGNQITLYYDTNTWNFTRLGKVEGLSQSELKQILGNGDITMVLSQNE